MNLFTLIILFLSSNFTRSHNKIRFVIAKPLEGVIVISISALIRSYNSIIQVFVSKNSFQFADYVIGGNGIWILYFYKTIKIKIIVKLFYGVCYVMLVLLYVMRVVLLCLLCCKLCVLLCYASCNSVMILWWVMILWYVSQLKKKNLNILIKPVT